jgi:hypothetical protein
MGLYDQLKKEWDAISNIDDIIREEAYKEQKKGNEQHFILPNGFIWESVPEGEREKLEKSIKWLITSVDFSSDGISENKLCAIKEGLSLIFDLKFYQADSVVEKEFNALKKNLDYLLDPKACSLDVMPEKEFRKLKDDTEKYVSRLFGAKAYARDAISSEELCNLIVMGIPDLRQMGSNKNILKKIAEKIPTRTTMSAIINKSGKDGKIEEVDRKLLILVWLLSGEGAILPYEKGEEKESYIEHLTIINRKLLEPYGMPSLDPRNPFDWIVMNSLHYAYLANLNEDDDIDDTADRIKAFIDKLK